MQAKASKDDWPANTRLSYRLKGNYRGDLHGSAKVEWQRRSENYEVLVELRMAIFLTVTMTSQGSLSDAGLLPRVYEEKYPGSVRRIVFDGVAVKFNDGSAARQPEALQDTASQFVELSRRFSSGRQALEVGATLTLWLARPSGMDLWTYDVVAREALELPEYGSVEAFHLRPRPLANPRGPITAELWFAPSLQYLPVRIKISLGSGNFVDLMVERIEQGAPESVICPPRTDSTSAPDQNCSPARGPE